MNCIATKINNGRLGNMLFQISCCISQAKKHNATPAIPEWVYAKYFKNPFPIGSISATHEYKEPSFNYTDIDFSHATAIYHRDSNVYDLQGYFQSEKYWAGNKQLILDQFEFSDYAIFGVYKKYRKDWFNGARCAVHVRRGDYVGNPYYAQLGMVYYMDAIAYVMNQYPSVRFYFFSDDIEYCKKMFVGDNFIFVEGNTDIADLILMSLCDHIIGANSSFSWWGSYLQKEHGRFEKIKIFPQQWFTDQAIDTKDLYLKEWITL